MKYWVEEIPPQSAWKFNRKHHFFIGAQPVCVEVTHDYFDRAFIERAEAVEESQGWYRRYGQNTSPLGEIQAELGGLTRGTGLNRSSVEGIWVFSGNHQAESAAFSYLIWDVELASTIERALAEQGVKRWPDMPPPADGGAPH